jgi:hypothetical protein
LFCLIGCDSKQNKRSNSSDPKIKQTHLETAVVDLLYEFIDQSIYNIQTKPPPPAPFNDPNRYDNWKPKEVPLFQDIFVTYHKMAAPKDSCRQINIEYAVREVGHSSHTISKGLTHYRIRYTNDAQIDWSQMNRNSFYGRLGFGPLLKCGEFYYIHVSMAQGSLDGSSSRVKLSYDRQSNKFEIISWDLLTIS